ncbi:hypothetical protein AAFN75_14365 [Algibacter sp. AS12]|uniref:hypothetical protein n=1 Tax=Algibacter sp. AS12 TaxID=3135773 RepID=UPI00398B0580
MINLIIKLSVLLTIIFLSAYKTDNSNAIENDSLTIENPYLAQKPPGLTPIPFAPGLASTEIYESNSAFTPDMKAFYFIRRGEENRINFK